MLVAAEQTGRVAYLMELDPVYVDVIIKRWQEMTGLEAVGVSGFLCLGRLFQGQPNEAALCI